MKVVFILLALQATLVAAGTYDDIKQQLRDLMQSSGSSDRSSRGSSSGGSDQFVQEEEEGPVGKIRGLFSKMMNKMKSALPGGKKKSDEEGSGPITLNDYSQDSGSQDKHLHLHKDHHSHHEKHRHSSHSKNLYDEDNFFPSRFKRDGTQTQKKQWTKEDFLVLLRKAKANSEKKRDEAKKANQKEVVAQKTKKN